MEEQAHYCLNSQDQQIAPDRILGTATLTKNMIVNLLVTLGIQTITNSRAIDCQHVTGRLAQFSANWERVITNWLVLDTVKGYKI